MVIYFKKGEESEKFTTYIINLIQIAKETMGKNRTAIWIKT